MPFLVNVSLRFAATASSFFICVLEPVANSKATGYWSGFTADTVALKPSVSPTEHRPDVFSRILTTNGNPKKCSISAFGFLALATTEIGLRGEAFHFANLSRFAGGL